jgi:hypothetical protein
VGGVQALSARHLAHVRSVAPHAGALQEVPDKDDQHRLGTLGRIMGELFAMAVTLAGAPAAADVHCTEASYRIAALWPSLEAADRPAGLDGSAPYPRVPRRP